MKLLYSQVFFSILFSLHAYAQNVEDSRTYTIQDGYKISVVSKCFVDNQGMIWLYGRANNASGFQLKTRKFILQRYDGHSFVDVKLPIRSEFREWGNIFEQAGKKGFYVGGISDSLKDLFFVNTNTLAFTRVKNFSDMMKGALAVQTFPAKEKVLLFAYWPNETKIFEVSNGNCILLGEIDHKDHIDLHFSNLIPFKDHFVVNNNREGIFAFDYKGQSIKRVRLPKQIKVSDAKEHLILSKYNRKGKTFIQLRNFDYWLFYNEKENSLISTAVKIPDELNTNNEAYWNRLELLPDSAYGSVASYLSNEKSNIDEKKPNIKKASVVYTRDFSKELILFDEGKMQHLFFENKQVKKFLKGYSIRGVYQETSDKFIVSTALNGWYRINTRTNQTEYIPTRLNGTLNNFEFNRAIFSDRNTYWSNDKNGIVEVSKENLEATSYINFPVACMAEDEQNIYYGTISHRLMRFDKVKRKNIALANTEDLDIIDIILHEKNLYAATNKGLLTYKNGVLKVHTVDGKNDFISIDYDSHYGILIGNRTGALYQYDISKNIFAPFYQDDKNASIASVLVDDEKLVWINSFAGIVSYNPRTKEKVRFGEEDGFSHYECNRYSALKTSDGRFVVGTLSGVNFFNPSSLLKSNTKEQSAILGLSYYNKKQKKWFTEYNTDKLKAIREVKLPAGYPNLIVQVGLLGIVNHNKIAFRYKINNQKWLQLSNDNKVQLFNLSDGHHKLSIQAYTLVGCNQGEPIILNIDVEKVFYKRWWFILFISLLFIGLGYYFYNQLRKENEHRKMLAQNLLIGQEEERARLAKELHDGIGQNLILMKNYLKTKEHTAAGELASTTLNEVRAMSQGLHPFILEKLGFTAAVKKLLNEVDEATEIFVSQHIENIDDLLSKENAMILYRAFQEALNNVLKHAETKSLDVSCVIKDVIRLEIKDFGKGIQQEKLKSAYASLGLRTLEERARLLDAELEIKSEVGMGTSVIFTIPITNQS